MQIEVLLDFSIRILKIKKIKGNTRKFTFEVNNVVNKHTVFFGEGFLSKEIIGEKNVILDLKTILIPNEDIYLDMFKVETHFNISLNYKDFVLHFLETEEIGKVLKQGMENIMYEEFQTVLGRTFNDLITETAL